MILMTVGVGLFGTFTAYISSWFIEGNRQQHESDLQTTAQKEHSNNISNS
jgi:hypothetical protein